MTTHIAVGLVTKSYYHLRTFRQKVNRKLYAFHYHSRYKLQFCRSDFNQESICHRSMHLLQDSNRNWKTPLDNKKQETSTYNLVMTHITKQICCLHSNTTALTYSCCACLPTQNYIYEERQGPF